MSHHYEEDSAKERAEERAEERGRIEGYRIGSKRTFREVRMVIKLMLPRKLESDFEERLLEELDKLEGL